MRTVLRKPRAASYRHNVALIMIFICFIYYVCVRGFSGNFYIPSNTQTVYYQLGGNTFATTVLYLGFSISLIMGMREYENKCGPKYILTPLIMFVPIFLWCVIDIFNGHSLRSLLGITTICPLTFFMLFAAYIGMNPIAWGKVVTICNIAAITFVLLSAIATVVFITNYGSVNIANSPQIIFLSIGFIPLAIRVLLSSKTNNIVNVTLLIAAILCAIFYNSRGWIVQLLLLSMCYFFIRNQKYSLARKVVYTIVALTVIVLVFYAATQIFPERVSSLMNKFDTGFASRAWQYNDLLSQYSFSDLLFGKGSFATYDTEVYGTFMYFDNAFVNISMKYGVGVAIIFLVILLKTPLKLLLSKKPNSSKHPALIIMLFFAAIMGVSVYFVVTVDLKFFLISIVLGRCEYLYRCQRSIEIGEETDER